ncbi:MAG: 50S ribosomal protein L25 [Tepidanaerobacteraceae bacterium]|nr:50S ribosomal protein L25 [Tepidanaerobacteraceae bacterium]
MSESVICAVERAEKPNKVRKQGFIPGVVYGKDIKSTSIKLDQKEYKKLLQGHAKNTKVRVKLGNEVKHCIIKEVQKDSVNGQILHVELQTIHSDDIIRLKVPIVFHGKEKLAIKQQLLQELIPEVEIMGKVADMPEFVCIDVGNRKLGDKITVKDIQIGNGIKIIDDESEILAVITAIKEYSEAS